MIAELAPAATTRAAARSLTRWPRARALSAHTSRGAHGRGHVQAGGAPVKLRPSPRAAWSCGLAKWHSRPRRRRARPRRRARRTRARSVSDRHRELCAFCGTAEAPASCASPWPAAYWYAAKVSCWLWPGAPLFSYANWASFLLPIYTLQLYFFVSLVLEHGSDGTIREDHTHLLLMLPALTIIWAVIAILLAHTVSPVPHALDAGLRRELQAHRAPLLVRAAALPPTAYLCSPA
eukprot:scaffold630_cov399-Prasinococcus_capsulatus_cf.AAC.36